MSYPFLNRREGSGLEIMGYAGENLPTHNVVYLDNVGLWRLADADAVATMPVVGFTKEPTLNGNRGTILLHGMIGLATWTWTPGGILYASTTAGEITQTAPTRVQEVGIAYEGDVIYFHPGLRGLGIDCDLLAGPRAYVGFDECLSAHTNYFLCNGTADDVAINQAITYVSGIGRGTIHFDAGTYDITTPIVLMSNVSLDLSQAVLREGNGANLIQMIYLNGVTNCSIVGGYLDGNKANQGAGGHGIQVRWLTDPGGKVFIRDVVLERFLNRTIYVQMNGDYVGEVLIDGCTCRDGDNYGMYIVAANDVQISNCIVDDCLAATISNCHRVNIDNSIFKNNPQLTDVGSSCGLWITGSNDVNISHCTAYNNTGFAGMMFSQCRNTQVSGCDCYENEYGFLVGNAATENVVFSGCNSYNNAVTGFSASDGAENVVVSDGSAYLNGRAGVWFPYDNCVCSGMLIMNNNQILHPNYDSGVVLGHMGGGATGCVVTGCRIFDDQGVQTQAYGVEEFHANCDYNLIEGNDLRGNATGSLLLQGTHTKAFDNQVDGTSTITAGVEIPSREWLVTYGSGGISVAGDVPLAAITNGQSAAVGFECPSDLQQLVRAYLKVLPNATQGAANWDLNSDYGGMGQAPNTHSEVDAATTYNVTNNQWYDIELVALGFFANLAIGDRGGIRLTVSTAGHNASVFSLIFEYL